MFKWQVRLSTIIFLQLNFFLSSAQSFCGAASIDSAEYRYDIGMFDECIEGLNKCLINKGSFNFDQKVQAYHLLANSYLAIDSTQIADSIIEELLLLKDNFETDFRDPERFKNKVASIRSNIISSVSKRNEEIRLAPATNIVITQEEIFQRGYNDLTDVLKDIPGFDISIYYGQLYANVYQRGLRTNNTEKTLLLVDGVEENDLWSNFADISQQYPLTNIKRIEVIYGPASTMYGPNAFSGVINIITKEPNDYVKHTSSFGINANAGTGSYDTKYLDLSAAYKKSIFSFSATGRFYKSDRPDLSQQSLWDYDIDKYHTDLDHYNYKKFLSIRNPEEAKAYILKYHLDVNAIDPYYKIQPDSSKIILTDAGAAFAQNYNETAYENAAMTKFKNPSWSSYLNLKLNIADFSIGFVTWAKTEGIGTSLTDFIGSVSTSRWKPAHHYIYLNYNKRLNEKLVFTAFLNYRIHSIRNGSKINIFKHYTSIRDYFTGNDTIGLGLQLIDFINKVPPTWITNYYYEQSEQFRSEFKLIYNLRKYFYLISGIELRNSQLQGYYLTSSTSPIPQDYGNYPYADSTGGNQYNVNDIGVYTQGSYHSKNGFGITLGARLDYNQIRHGKGLGYELSPRLVLDYSLKGWVFKIIAGRGIENVSNYTKFNQVNVAPNPSLKSEAIYNYEVSVSNKLSNSLLADVMFYYLNVKNVISTTLANHLLQNRNIGEYKITGLQANLYYKSANKKLQATVNYTYTNPKQVKGVITDDLGTTVNEKFRVGDIASHKFNAIINSVVYKNININLRGNYVSSKPTGEGTSVPLNKKTHFSSYLILNAVATLNNIVKFTSVQFGCNNVFNKIYYSPGVSNAGGLRVPDQILQMGRNYFARLSYEF